MVLKSIDRDWFVCSFIVRQGIRVDQLHTFDRSICYTFMIGRYIAVETGVLTVDVAKQLKNVASAKLHGNV
jgi:hypothetical protein